ncbi:MAG: hypothetical protein ACXWPS_19555 [Ktedonobacteraceae bacterium]
MEIVDRAGILRKQGLQEIMGGICCDFLADQTQADRDSPHVRVYR